MNFLRKIKQFAQYKDGATAVEFAFIAVPFIFLMIGIFELAIMFASAYLLQGATADGARIIRTGQAQESGDAVGAFEDELCDRIGIFLDCDDLQYEVIHIPDDTFETAEDYEPTYDDDGNLISNGFDAGDINDVIMVRAAYRYRFVTPFIGLLMADGGGNSSRLLMTTYVFKNEPYNFE